jgi:hypothetical protein
LNSRKSSTGKTQGLIRLWEIRRFWGAQEFQVPTGWLTSRS